MSPGLLDGQSAIVTGAAQGIGAGFAEVLAEEGATVTLCDVKETVLEVAAASRRAAAARRRSWPTSPGARTWNA